MINENGAIEPSKESEFNTVLKCPVDFTLNEEARFDVVNCQFLIVKSVRIFGSQLAFDDLRP